MDVAPFQPPPVAAGVPYICGGAPQQRSGRADASCRLCRADCGYENTIKPGDHVQCRECGYRILYKKRTKRSACPLRLPRVGGRRLQLRRPPASLTPAVSHSVRGPLVRHAEPQSAAAGRDGERAARNRPGGMHCTLRGTAHQLLPGGRACGRPRGCSSRRLPGPHPPPLLPAVRRLLLPARGGGASVLLRPSWRHGPAGRHGPSWRHALHERGSSLLRLPSSGRGRVRGGLYR